MTFKIFKGIDLTILKIVGIYALFGGLWIYASDTIVAWVVIDPEILKTISMFKGFLFIALTSSLLFFLIVRYFNERTRVEQALQQEQKLYEDLVNTLPAGVYRLRAKTHGNWSAETWRAKYEVQYSIDFASDHFCDIMGISHDAVVANHSVVLDSIYYDDKEDFNARNAQAMTDLDPFIWEGRIIRNKQTRWVHFESHPRIIDSDIVLWTGIVYDITERKQVDESLKESEEQLRVIFETSQSGIILVGPQGTILFANSRMAEIFGMPLVELTGSSYSEHLHPAEKKTGDDLMRQLIRGDIKSVSDERHYIRANGSDFWGYLSGKRLENPDGTLRALVGIIADITEQNWAKTELKRKNAEIEQFLYTVSHDLRSPLVTVKTFMGFLEQDMSASDNERIAKDIVFINSAADRMESLLNELLEISKVGRVEALDVSIAFKELIAEALDSVSGQIAANKVNVIIVTDTNLVLQGDSRRLLQIWQNLLDNAVKYIGDEAAPCIKIGLKEQHGETVFFVCDNGVGIAPEYQDKVFGIFEQLDRNSEGVGMGLTMIKRIVEMYGGRIWVDSKGEGRGSCFWFTLPNAVQQG